VTPPRSALRELADRRGIVDGYWDVTGREYRETSDATRVALLAAMGVDASSEEAARRTLAAEEDRERERVLEPVAVWRERADAEPALRLRVPPAVQGAHGRVSWRLELVLEDGSATASEGTLVRSPGSAWSAVPLPFAPAPGHHRVRLALAGPGTLREAEQRFVVAPRCALRAEEKLGARRTYGLWTNLYTVRSERGFGAGDLGDLRRLVEWCAAEGGAFVGVNPLHALRNRGHDISPYGPRSRLFRNPLYLDVEAVPELAECEEARALLRSPELAAARAKLRALASIDYAGVWEAKRAVLAILHRRFAERHRGRATPRGEAYRAHLAARGTALEDFATFSAIEDHRYRARGRDTGWRAWPAGLRHPRSPSVARFRREHAEQVDFQRWLQLELDRQLGETARAAAESGMALGVYQDLAVGSAGDSSDTWAFQGVFAEGASAGAPPDDYAAKGQDWGLPPLDPVALRASGYDYWIQLLRAGFAHAGALRIDHVLGLFRLFWIPAGGEGKDGAYVRYPADELLGILALESRRAGALVVGEDLGTVPADVPGRLASWGVLSSRLLYFEREGERFRASSRYSPRALVAASTHDLAPLAGWWEGRDLLRRREAGQLASDEELAQARGRRGAEREALRRCLVEEGLLAPAADGAEPAPGALCAAVNAFLCRTPAPLVALSLDDLAGEREPVNLPGVPVERHPSWSRKMERSLEEIPAAAAAALAGAATRGGAR
jgi:4-alpha-glucanotransferase